MKVMRDVADRRGLALLNLNKATGEVSEPERRQEFLGTILPVKLDLDGGIGVGPAMNRRSSCLDSRQGGGEEELIASCVACGSLRCEPTANGAGRRKDYQPAHASSEHPADRQTKPRISSNWRHYWARLTHLQPRLDGDQRISSLIVQTRSTWFRTFVPSTTR